MVRFKVKKKKGIEENTNDVNSNFIFELNNIESKSSELDEKVEIKKEIFFEDENLTAYTEGDRAYIKFIMRPQRQLIVALKSRKWWWNSTKKAWSTYLNKLDKEWVSTISERYSKYI